MKITKDYLKKVIKEEYNRLINEGHDPTEEDLIKAQEEGLTIKVRRSNNEMDDGWSIARTNTYPKILVTKVIEGKQKAKWVEPKDIEMPDPQEKDIYTMMYAPSRAQRAEQAAKLASLQRGVGFTKKPFPD